MMKFVLITIGAIVIGWASFLLTRKTTMQSLRNHDAIFETFQMTNSGWLYSDTIGSNAASSVERARVALSGPLGLSSKEVVYFIAQTDNQKNRLSSSCDYQVSGQSMDARWWSVALYDSETEKYVPNSINRSSWNSEAIDRKDNGDWVIYVSGKPKEVTWLPAQPIGGKSFELMLRVYNPGDKLRHALPNIKLPKVERMSCD